MNTVFVVTEDGYSGSTWAVAVYETLALAETAVATAQAIDRFPVRLFGLDEFDVRTDLTEKL